MKGYLCSSSLSYVQRFSLSHQGAAMPTVSGATAGLATPVGCNIVIDTSKTNMPDSRASTMTPQASRHVATVPGALLGEAASRPGSWCSVSSRVDATSVRWMVWRKIQSRISWRIVALPCTEGHVMALFLSAAAAPLSAWQCQLGTHEGCIRLPSQECACAL